jgi:hypothetical protein
MRNNMTNTQKLLIVILTGSLILISGCTEKSMESGSMASGGMPATENAAAKEIKEAVIKGDYQEIDCTGVKG